MADLAGATKAYLKADSTLTAIVAADKILDAEDVGREGLKVEHIKQIGTPLVGPAIYINWTTEAPYQATMLDAVQAFVEIYFYQHSKYGIIKDMKRRVWELLHQQRVVIDDPGADYVYAFIWRGDVVQMKDPELNGCSMERSRYEIHYLRRVSS